MVFIVLDLADGETVYLNTDHITAITDWPKDRIDKNCRVYINNGPKTYYDLSEVEIRILYQVMKLDEAILISR